MAVTLPARTSRRTRSVRHDSELQSTALPSPLRRTVWTYPAAACVGRVCDQRRKIASTMLRLAARHGRAIAPEEDGVDTSGGNLRRSGLRPAPGGRTDHLSVLLQATAAPSLLRGTVWTPPAAACVGQVCDQRREVAPTISQSNARPRPCHRSRGGRCGQIRRQPAQVSSAISAGSSHGSLSDQLQATAMPSLLRRPVWTAPAAACIGHVSDQRREVAPTIPQSSCRPRPCHRSRGRRGHLWRQPAQVRSATSAGRSHGPSLRPAAGHGRAIAPEEDGVKTSGGSLRRSGLRPAPGGRTNHLSVQLQATAMPSLPR